MNKRLDPFGDYEPLPPSRQVRDLIAKMGGGVWTKAPLSQHQQAVEGKYPTVSQRLQAGFPRFYRTAMNTGGLIGTGSVAALIAGMSTHNWVMSAIGLALVCLWIVIFFASLGTRRWELLSPERYEKRSAVCPTVHFPPEARQLIAQVRARVSGADFTVKTLGSEAILFIHVHDVPTSFIAMVWNEWGVIPPPR